MVFSQIDFSLGFMGDLEVDRYLLSIVSIVP